MKFIVVPLMVGMVILVVLVGPGALLSNFGLPDDVSGNALKAFLPIAVCTGLLVWAIFGIVGGRKKE